MTAAEVRQRLNGLHATVDREVATLVQRLPGPLACRRGCRDCCRDGLTVFTVEADLIRHHHSELLATGRPHPGGGCAFLDADGGCRIYDHRPYVCRTQGLPLRWRETPQGPEFRDVCPLNVEPLGMAPDDLDPGLCWELGPWEGRLASLQVEAQGGFRANGPRRVFLRQLFGRVAPGRTTRP